jgi:hypothetical protein
MKGLVVQGSELAAHNGDVAGSNPAEPIILIFYEKLNLLADRFGTQYKNSFLLISIELY